MAIVSLLVGASLGLGLMLGVPIWLALTDQSPLWLIGSAFILNAFAKPLSLRNDILERALADGTFPRAVFYVWLLPWGIIWTIQLAIYWVAALL